MSLQERLEKRRRVDPETGCWLWLGAKAPDGHGRILVNYKTLVVSRVAMHVYKGFDLGSADMICHVRHCPNAHCFWPEHLYIGNGSTNQKDAIATGRQSKYWGSNKR